GLRLSPSRRHLARFAGVPRPRACRGERRDATQDHARQRAEALSAVELIAERVPLQWRVLLLPNEVGEVSAQRTEGSCIKRRSMTPPSPYDGDTSPRAAWGGKRRHWSGARPA